MVEKISIWEIRKTIATSMGTAFGIVIGMVWTQAVLGIFAAAGVQLTVGTPSWTGVASFIITAIIVTVVCVVAIVYLGKWGGKEK